MRPLWLRFALWFCALLAAPAILAHDVTISGPTSFASLDGSSLDHDGVANGIFTVNDGSLIVDTTINCNDDGIGPSACAMAFAVSGDLVLNAGGGLSAENRLANGSGGAITLDIGGNLVINAGALVSAASRTHAGDGGGAITMRVLRGITIASGAVIDAGSVNAKGGLIDISAGGSVNVSGNIFSGPSRTLLATRHTGPVLDGGNLKQGGGAISLRSTTFIEPGISIAATANIVSQGEENGAGSITLEGCGITVHGLVAAVSRKNSPAIVILRSGKNLVIDGRDLVGSGARMGRVRADALEDGANDDRVDLFARQSVTVAGPTTGSIFAVTSLPGAKGNKDSGGTIRLVALEGSITAGGLSFAAGIDGKATAGGTISLAAATDVKLDGGTLIATGDYGKAKKQSGGGHILLRAYSGNVFWRNGVGDVRPIGSAADVPPASQGTIALTACSTIDSGGSAFPTNGAATGLFPESHIGICTPAAPSLPDGVPPLLTCNTSPVANSSAASTNEDVRITLHLSGSDVDGDALTFSIVAAPLHGTLGTLIPTGPTTADVDYTPAADEYGSDGFTFRVNDGNGGTAEGSATITVAAVNDPPAFRVGATQIVLEDAGAQTVANWVTGISVGPPNESAQSIVFTVSTSAPQLFSAPPAVAPDGTLTFAPAADATGTATITVVARDSGGTANGGQDTSAPQISSITLTPVNDAPSFVAGPSQTVNEDGGPQSVAGWATSISAGPHETQNLAFVTSNDNTPLFTEQPAVSPGGTLTWTPAANANGSASVTVYLKDDGGTANGGHDTSSAQTFTITLTAVNDPPSFNGSGGVTVLEDSASYGSPWAGSIAAGPPNESGQTLTFKVTNDNAALFAAQPAISPAGVLSFLPAPNVYGNATVTVTLSDNGGTANGGSDTSGAQTFVISITPVNDAPTFSAGGNVAVNEDSATYSAAWATAVSSGPQESGQTLTFQASNDNNGLFAVQPSVGPDGTLHFAPAANANGSAVVTVALRDDGGTANGGADTSATQTFTITVNAVNDAPSFTNGGPLTLLEDSGAYAAPWATNMSPGPADESNQNLAFQVTNDNNALFAAQPAISSAGLLTFTPAANASGTATVTATLSDDGGTGNGGSDKSGAATFSITLTPVNDAPSFTGGGNITRDEDSGAYSAPWATSLSAGPQESGQTLTFHVSSDDSALFSAQPSISSTGVLSFTPAANANGSASVTVYLQDDGGTANGGADKSGSQTFTIVINAVNDPPSFTSSGNVAAFEDSPFSAIWFTNISRGPADEAGQAIAFTIASNSNPALFAAGPQVAANGTLSFTPTANAYGSATVVVRLKDDGGTANGGNDTATTTVTIVIAGINDAPSFVSGGDVVVAENSGAYSGPWATSISAGPNESTQSVHFNVSNNAPFLFSVQPAISPAGVLTFTPAMSASGSATLTVTLSDNGGTAGGGVDTSAPVDITVTVAKYNPPPVAAADTFAGFGNTEVRVDLAAGPTPAVLRTTASGHGVLDNDSDPEGDPITVTGIVGCADTIAPFNCTLSSGVVSMNADGRFSFVPAPGSTNPSFQYVITDGRPGKIPATATGTVTLNLTDMIWYVNGSAAPGGNGTSAAPFASFVSLNGAGGAGDVDDADAIIFVHDSVVSGGIALETSQKLIGQGVGLTVRAYPLVAPGNKARINAAGDAVSVFGVSGTEIAGLQIASSGGNAIDVTATGLNAAATTIHDCAISGAGLEGIDVNVDSLAGAAVTVNNTPIVSTLTGFDVRGGGPAVVAFSNGSILSTAGSGIRFDGSGSGGKLTIVGLNNVTIDGNTAGDGINIVSAKFDAVPAGNLEPISGGAITVGSSGNPVGGAGVVMSGISGDYSISALNLFAGTSGLSVAGTGLFTGPAGMRLTAAGSIAAAAGVGLSVTNATIGAAGLNFGSISAAGGPNGIVLSNTGTAGSLTVSGSGTAASGGTIQNVSGDAILLASTNSVHLSFLNISNSGQSHIDATNVDGLTLIGMNLDLSADHGIVGDTVRNLVIQGGVYDRGGAASASPNKHGVFVTNLLGNSSVSGATFRRSNTIQFRVLNSAATNAPPGAPDVLTVSNTTWDTHSGGFSGDHLSVESTSGGNLRLVTTAAGGANTFSTGGSALQAASSGEGRMELSATGLRVDGSAVGVIVAASGASTLNFDIFGNRSSNGTGFTNTGSLAVAAVNTGTGLLRGTVRDNTVVNARGSTAVQVIQEGNGTVAASLANNDISGEIVNNGIRGQARLGNGLLALTIASNTVSSAHPDALDAIAIESGGSGSGHANSVCLNMTNNNASVANGQHGYRLRQRPGTTFNLQNFSGSGTSATDVVNWIHGKGNVGSVEIPAGSTFSSAAGACLAP